jgi:lysozyme family protein
MTDISALTAENAACWAKAVILPGRLAEVQAVAKRLTAPDASAIYRQISQAAWGTPDRWWFVAIVHEREASQDFTKSIAQGDPYDKVSSHVPRGIGPFKSFFDAAVFALTRCAPYAGKWTDWTIGGVLTLLVLYNGTGYEDYHHEVSPYDWGATTMEEEGKYVEDGKWSPDVWDSQIGCAAMLKAMIAIDPSITFAATAAAAA